LTRRTFCTGNIKKNPSSVLAEEGPFDNGFLL